MRKRHASQYANFGSLRQVHIKKGDTEEEYQKTTYEICIQITYGLSCNTSPNPELTT